MAVLVVAHISLADAVRDAVKEHANTNHGVTFGILDTVKLVGLSLV